MLSMHTAFPAHTTLTSSCTFLMNILYLVLAVTLHYHCRIGRRRMWWLPMTKNCHKGVLMQCVKYWWTKRTLCVSIETRLRMLLWPEDGLPLHGRAYCVYNGRTWIFMLAVGSYVVLCTACFYERPITWVSRWRYISTYSRKLRNCRP